jgi:hypothetical protein
MHINTAFDVSNTMYSNVRKSDLNNLDVLDCTLITEDAKGHHTFQASPEMTQAIMRFLEAL